MEVRYQYICNHCMRTVQAVLVVPDARHDEQGDDDPYCVCERCLDEWQGHLLKES